VLLCDFFEHFGVTAIPQKTQSNPQNTQREIS